MMGRPQRIETKLYYTGFCLDDRIRADNPLRVIHSAIDFDFIRPLVRPLYGRRGNESVDPAMLLKLMFILFYENVRSERELMARMPERLDWLWFCGLDLDSDIPDHSVISKARKRWGVEAFAAFFTRVLDQCVQAGLVDGSQVHVDSSLLAANADKSKLQTALRLSCREFYDGLEVPSSTAKPVEPVASGPELGIAISPADPDARLTRKNGKTYFGYKDHRVVDDRHGVITATATTPANVKDDVMLMGLLEKHEENTGLAADAVAADSAYGTAENYQRLEDQAVRPAIPHQRQKGIAGKFGRDRFRYDEARDCYVCPAGQPLPRTGRLLNGGQHLAYRAKAGVCRACPLRDKCTDAQCRTFARHVLQQTIDWADELLDSWRGRQMMRRRRIRAEGSFADAIRHGYKHARWRGLANMSVQTLMISTIQNIRKLVKYGLKRPLAGVNACIRTILRAVTHWFMAEVPSDAGQMRGCHATPAAE